MTCALPSSLIVANHVVRALMAPTAAPTSRRACDDEIPVQWLAITVRGLRTDFVEGIDLGVGISAGPRLEAHAGASCTNILSSRTFPPGDYLKRLVLPTVKE